MPKGNKTPGILVAEVKMTRMSHDGSLLVVEGESDVRFWAPRRHGSCAPVDGEGKQNVIRGILKLDAASFAGVLGVVDSDYDSLPNMDDTGFKSVNLLRTDAHDLECILCRSSALDRVFAEYGKLGKIKRFEDATGADARAGLLKRALIFGRLRWASLRCQPAISLAGLRVPRFVDENTWTVASEERICMELLDSPEDILILRRCLDELPEANPWHIVNGQDLVEILRIGLRGVLGEIPATVGLREIKTVLRVGMPSDDLRATKLWRDMRIWESANHPYLVLADAGQ